MPPAARMTDVSTHGGTIVGPGEPTVLIGGMPASVVGDTHVCALPPSGHQPTSSPFPMGSTTVFIGGKPAIRVGDTCICGAAPAVGEPTVMIG
ncbi:MAG: PAAR domain-containing protein [Candidatus Marinimicrobia bacterium]|nr:PAAR domain-containing protein [Candidatus Neomarinimicrobiota bacterium]MCF7880864.1 PAAR domain-containing protein [Candidatus Neomarinimicrobiota bacterium]